MKYHLSYDNALTHLINIRLEIDEIKEAEIFLQLPSWRPGRYEAANFAKNILKVVAFDYDNNQLAIKKITKDRWSVNTLSNRSIKIEYVYYAYEMDAGNSWLDDEQLYINFINCMFSVEGRIDESCTINLNLPESYQIASGLIEQEKHLLSAESYYQLVDSPIIASNTLKHFSYKVLGTSFNIWIQGEHKLDTCKMLHDFEQFTKVQIDVMGEFPCASYDFLIQALPYRHYHGVEHQNSTVITIGPADELSNDLFYRALLGISSHELFHTWNVIRIRPQEMLPYDFSKENYFETGFVAEGFTTYFGDLFLVKSGILDIKWYLGKVNKMLQNHFENFGRVNMSVVDASFDLWLDGYVPGTPNRKVSIYNEGAIIALMLDLQIRVQSDHQKSLDDVLRVLWKMYGRTNIGYNSNSILEILNDLTVFDWQNFFDHYIYGTTPIEKKLSYLLEYFGCKLFKSTSLAKNESLGGFRVDVDHRIIKIQPGSVAESYLSIGDHVKNLADESIFDSETTTLTIERNHKAFSVELLLGTNHYFEYYQIIQKHDLSLTEKEAFKKWIGK